MRFAALATDYDGTLAQEGFVSNSAVDALLQLRGSGRRLILVTGRTLANLREVFPRLDRFDLIVAENGGTLYNPSTNKERILAECPSEVFLRALRRRRVSSLEVGHVIVATPGTEKDNIVDAIREVGLELQIIFNKGSLMVLPSGCNKASGLQAAAIELGLSLRSVAGIGDAENDHAMLATCEFSAAVANALPSLKQRVQFVTQRESGAGVIELVEWMIQNDLADSNAWLGQPVAIGRSGDGTEVAVPACGVIVLAGPSGECASALAAALQEGMENAGYQFCALNVQGDHEPFAQALALGDSRQAPEASDVLKALERPSQSVVVNLAGLEPESRSNFFRSFFPRFEELRARTGRPHCLIVDEAHHFLRAPASGQTCLLPEPLWGLLLISASPEQLPAEVLRDVQMLTLNGEQTGNTLETLCAKIQCEPPAWEHVHLNQGQMLGWHPRSPRCFSFTPVQTR